MISRQKIPQNRSQLKISSIKRKQRFQFNWNLKKQIIKFLQKIRRLEKNKKPLLKQQKARIKLSRMLRMRNLKLMNFMKPK